MDHYSAINAKYNAQASGLSNQQGLSGSISGQIGVQTTETLQMLSAENTSKLKRVNQQLATLRSRLFGECEIEKDNAPDGPKPSIPSLGGSLAMANDELLEAFRQLDALVNRV